MIYKQYWSKEDWCNQKFTCSLQRSQKNSSIFTHTPPYLPDTHVTLYTIFALTRELTREAHRSHRSFPHGTAHTHSAEPLGPGYCNRCRSRPARRRAPPSSRHLPAPRTPRTFSPVTTGPKVRSTQKPSQTIIKPFLKKESSSPPRTDRLPLHPRLPPPPRSLTNFVLFRVSSSEERPLRFAFILLGPGGSSPPPEPGAAWSSILPAAPARHKAPFSSGLYPHGPIESAPTTGRLPMAAKAVPGGTRDAYSQSTA